MIACGDDFGAASDCGAQDRLEERIAQDDAAGEIAAE
jgi:hypothetical protein